MLLELQAVADIEATLRAAYKALAPGGVMWSVAESRASPGSVAITSTMAT